MLSLSRLSVRFTGSITLDGTEPRDAPERQLRRLRGSRLALVGQDALAAHNPLATPPSRSCG